MSIDIEGTAGSGWLPTQTEETGEEKMTKLRGYIPTMTVILFLAFGSTIANAGIIVGDRATESTKTDTCGDTTTGMVVDALTKIATFATTGIIVGDRTGIIVGDRSTTGCTEGDGIIVGDRNGIIVGD